MARHDRFDRTTRRSLLALVGFLLVAGLLSIGSAAAHTFTRTDGNDSPSKIDLKSASVSHTSTGVVHKVQTFNAWTPRSLGDDSFFIIQIDKNNDRNYERCAFIFYTSRLRGSLTNCGAVFIRFLPVAKLSGTTAKITIPKSQTGNVYWWAGVSVWDGPSPCANVCVDFVPNLFPDILHDMIKPVVNMVTTPLRVWEDSTGPAFGLPFSVSDAHSGIESWTVQSHAIGSGTWTFVLSGTGAGSKDPPITSDEGTRLDYRVVARDKQGNQRIGPTRRVYIPRDDDSLGPEGEFSSPPPTPVADPDAFGGFLSPMAAAETLTYTWSPDVTDCLFELIGPGGGTWTIDVSADSGPITSVSDADTDPLPRQTIYSDDSCATTYVVTVTAGIFNLDAVLG